MPVISFILIVSVLIFAFKKENAPIVGKAGLWLFSGLFKFAVTLSILFWLRYCLLSLV
jgi:Zn-dependent protease with chaperone function